MFLPEKHELENVDQRRFVFELLNFFAVAFNFEQQSLKLEMNLNYCILLFKLCDRLDDSSIKIVMMELTRPRFIVSVPPIAKARFLSAILKLIFL